MIGIEFFKSYLSRMPWDVKDEIDPESVPCIETSDADKLCRKPFVSVMMITYNHEAWISEAIEGVVSQIADFEYELIIGEDASSDKTREICFEYQKKYPEKIRVLYSNGNVGATSNTVRCAERVRGEVLALCEGDDFWTDPHKLQKQVAQLKRDGVVMCVARNVVRKVDGTEYETKQPLRPYLRIDDLLKYYYHTSTYTMWFKDYKRARALYPGIHQWYDVTMICCMASIGKVVLLPEVVSTWRMTGKGMSTGITKQHLACLCVYQQLAMFLYGPQKWRKQFGCMVLRCINSLSFSKTALWTHECYEEYTRDFIFARMYLCLQPSLKANYLFLRQFYCILRMWVCRLLKVITEKTRCGHAEAEGV